MKLQQDRGGKTFVQSLLRTLLYRLQKARLAHKQDLALALASQKDRERDMPRAVFALFALLALDDGVVRQLVVQAVVEGGARRLAGDKGRRARVAFVLVEKRCLRQSEQ